MNLSLCPSVCTKATPYASSKTTQYFTHLNDSHTCRGQFPKLLLQSLLCQGAYHLFTLEQTGQTTDGNSCHAADIDSHHVCFRTLARCDQKWHHNSSKCNVESIMREDKTGKALCQALSPIERLRERGRGGRCKERAGNWQLSSVQGRQGQPWRWKCVLLLIWGHLGRNYYLGGPGDLFLPTFALSQTTTGFLSLHATLSLETVGLWLSVCGWQGRFCYE